MFEKIRKPGRTKSIFSYIIFGSICVVFVFIGVPVSQMSNMGGTALVVNNKVISWGEYRSYLEMLEQQSQGALGADQGAKRQEKLRQQAVDTLLSIELITQEADSLGVAIAAKAVQDKIVELPLFQEEGRFSHSKYRAFLDARRFSASYFENLIRKEIRTSRFQNIFNFTVHISKEEKEKKQQLESFTIRVSYIQFSSNELTPGESNNIRSAVQAGDMDLLNQIIEDKKWKWEKTDSFNLNRVSLPGLESEKILFDEMLNHLPHTDMIKYIISVRDQSFILKIENFSQGTEQIAASPLSDSFFMNMMASRMTFLSWMRFTRSSAKLKFNPKLQNILQP